MIFTILLSSFLLLSFSINAQQDEISSKAIDVDKDKKVDRVENYKGTELISVARSTRYDGIFDETSYYYPYESPIKPTEVIEKDTDGDGKVDRVEKVYRNPMADLMIRTIKVTAKRNPAFHEKIWTIHTKLSQLKAAELVTCEEGLFNLENLPFMKLGDDVAKVRYLLDKGFYKTGWGYNIHQSCLDNWGAENFPNILKSSMTKGLQCLNDLAKKSNSKEGVYRLLKELELLYEKTPVTITCNEIKYDWENTAAHASAAPTDKCGVANVKHPFISLNPSVPGKGDISQDLKDELKATLFHEQLHNLGIVHGSDIEYPYACEACCISDNVTTSIKEKACKVCSGSYKNATDQQYIADVLDWGRSSYGYRTSLKAVNNFEKEFPGNRFGLFAYADASSNLLNGVGLELGKILREKFKDLTPMEEKFLKNSQEVKDDSYLGKAQEYSKLAASLHFQLYYESADNRSKVLDQFEKELPRIKKLMALKKNARGVYQDIYGRIVEEFKQQLTDIKLHKYPEPNPRETAHAQALLKKINL